MKLAPRIAGTTLLAASRAFARHVHVGEPFTRDLHTLRSLHALCDQCVPQTASPSKHAALLAQQRETLLTVERARSTWSQHPVAAAVSVLDRVEVVLGRAHAPAEVAARRPGMIEDLGRSVRDATSALLAEPGKRPKLENSLSLLADNLSRRLEEIRRERGKLNDGELTQLLRHELEAALVAAESTSASEVSHAARAADRVLEAWRQLVQLEPRPPFGLRVRRASTKLARAKERTREWEAAAPERVRPFYAPLPTFLPAEDD